MPTAQRSHADTTTRCDGAANWRQGFVITMIALLASLSISIVAQFTPAALPNLHAAYHSIWPQGWTFFTGLSTRVSTVGYTLTGDGRKLVPITQRRSLADRSWGLSRTGEADAADIAQIAQAVPTAYWQTCAVPNPGDCGAYLDLTRSYGMRGASGLLVLCGRIVVATESTQPRRVLRAAVVDVTCQR